VSGEAPTETAGRKPVPLHTKILVGLVLGAGIGGLLNTVLGGDSPKLEWATANITEPIGQLFLRLLLLLVVPLVFSSLTVGVAGIGDIRRIGRVGLKSFAYTLVISAISVLIGLVLANTIRPGDRIDPTTSERLQERYGSAAEKTVAAAGATRQVGDSPLMKLVKTIIPTNVFASVAKDTPDMLGLMFFALFFGIALTLVEPAKTRPVLAFLEGVFEAVAKCIQLVMVIAPYAVFCLLFTMTARFGFGLLASLGWYVGTVLLGLALHMFGVYSISVAVLSRIHPLEFFRRIKTVMITAFSTSSSNATLPTAMRVSEENLGVPRDINSFVLTVGATANQNGTALFEGVTVLFLAQLAGVDLSFAQQLMVLYLAILGGIGTAGVPSGSIPFVIVVLATVGVDPALIAIILGVDRILDMCRTVLNVTGDLTVATYVARSEGAVLLREQPVPASMDL
jgi:DAACS family dicarboxylate/amino acid:cation (Na+ or H+) symporter